MNQTRVGDQIMRPKLGWAGLNRKVGVAKLSIACPYAVPMDPASI